MRKYASANMCVLFQICTDLQSDQAAHGRANKYGREYFRLFSPRLSPVDYIEGHFSTFVLNIVPEFHERSLWGLFSCQ